MLQTFVEFPKEGECCAGVINGLLMEYPKGHPRRNELLAIYDRVLASIGGLSYRVKSRALDPTGNPWVPC